MAASGGFSDFVNVRSVDVGGVETSDAGVNGVVDDFDNLFFRFGKSLALMSN